MQRRYCRADYWIAALLVLITLVVCLLSIDSGNYWGDDYAAYINNAIAISEGTLEQQTRLNLFMHPCPLSFLKGDEDALYYVWGYPLLLVPIYRLFGFDRTTYSTLIYFKLPGVVFTALLAGVLYAFYRRRFGMCMSAVAVLLYVLNTRILATVNYAETEMPFIFFQTLSLLLVEMLESGSTFRRKLLLGIALGLSLWATYVIRLNGAAVLLACALCSLIGAWQDRHAPFIKQLLRVLPYALCGVLLWLSYQVLPVPTSNLSDLGQNTKGIHSWVYQSNVSELSEWARSFFTGGSMGFFYCGALPWLFLLLSVLGIFSAGVRKNFHLTALLIGSLIGLFTLNYVQSYRYLLPLFPLMLLFIGYGFQSFNRYVVANRIQEVQPVYIFCKYALPVMAATLVLLSNLDSGVQHFLHRGDSLASNNAYSTEAVDMYSYIRTETPPDSIVSFEKPRLLYLNTQRVSYCLQRPDLYEHNLYGPYHDMVRDLQYADYYLFYRGNIKSTFRDLQQMMADNGIADELVLVRTNKSFDLYQRIRAAE